MPSKHASKKRFFNKHAKHSHHPQKSNRAETLIEGRLDLKGSVGFIISEQPGVPDVLVQGPSLQLAMHSDRVKVRLRSSLEKGRRVGEIVDVIAHARKTFVGVFGRVNGDPALSPESAGPSLRLLDLNGMSPKEGELAVARITIWPTIHKGAGGVLEKVLGQREQPGVDLKALVYKFELSDEFPATVEAEANSFGSEVQPAALKGRQTLFDKTVITIDGADAKDFDDAVSLEPLPQGGWRLGVHIADVSHYVREGSPLDREAYERGTSVYLSGSVLPMLPFPLSDNLCSLRPEVVRLTLSCSMDIDLSGKVVGHKIFESAIKSARRFTYDEVETILNGQNVPSLAPKIIQDVREMGRVALLLRKKRFLRGSLDFDFPEPYVINDPHGRPVDIRRRERLESHRLIEDFMLLANETVATHMKKLPFLYRIHEKPDPTKLKTLRATLEAAGVPIPNGFEAGHPSALQKVIHYSEGKPFKPMVQMMILRSLKQALYSASNKGHFGLASSCYTHFTSPIRRYPDLVVHRLLKEENQGKLRNERAQDWTNKIPNIAEHSSRRERTAVEAEREFLDVQRVRLMEKHVGEKFTGVISGVTNFGLFVVLNQPFVEGLVHVTNLKDDYYFFDEVRVTLRGKRTGRVFRMGQPVNILLASANSIKRQLDFELIALNHSSNERHKKPI